MLITTKDLGTVEVDAKDVIEIPFGLYGFKDFHKFVLLSDNKENNPFMWLQSTENREPRFVVIDPLKIFENYKVPTSAAEPLVSIEDEKDLRLLAITTVTAGAKEIYVNLKCPIIINARENIAAQVILENEDYPLRYYLLKREG